MKNYLQTLSIVLFVLGISFDTSHAYDSHHPDPMSILNGHSMPRHTRRKIVDLPDTLIQEVPKTGIQKGRMYHRHKEGKYVFKPEPFSIAKKQADPELLGPQRTYKDKDNESNVTVSTASDQIKHSTPAMTRDACISLIGKEKFDTYVNKYGGETGAIHRCLVLKRLQGS